MHIEKRIYSCGAGEYERTHPDGSKGLVYDNAPSMNDVHRATKKHTVYVVVDQGRRVDSFLTPWAANRALKGLPRIPRPLPRYKRQHSPANTRLLGAPQSFRLTDDGRHAEQAMRQYFSTETDKAIALAEARYQDWLAARSYLRRAA